MLSRLQRLLRSDEGSSLVAVLVVMLVLTIGGLALATIVTNTTGIVVDTRSQSQSRVTADAGLAEVVASLKRGEVACGATGHNVAVDGTGSLQYDYAVTCGSGFATVRVNSAVNGARTAVQSVYAQTPAASSGGDMVFFGSGNVTFTSEVKTSADGRLLNIVVPQASFTCQSLIPGNITARGTVSANGGCTIKGTVTSAAGVLDMCCGSDTIEGNVATSGTGSSTVRGTLKGSLHTNGEIAFGWEGKQVAGSVIANGNVQLGNVRINGSLTMPTARTLSMQSGTIVGGTVRPTTVAGPTAPTLPGWFEYKFKTSDWPGYQVVTLKTSGTASDTCNGFNSSPGAAWTSLQTYTSPVIIDARACSTLSSNNGSKPTVGIKTNVVLLAKKFDLSGLTVKAGTGVAGKPKFWVMTEDPTPTDAAPTCGSGYGELLINGTVTDLTVKAMAYSPCKISVAGGAYGLQDKWNGSFYGGGWSYGGGLTFTADPIGVPGMGISESGSSGSGGIGGLISSRDVPYETIN